MSPCHFDNRKFLCISTFREQPLWHPKQLTYFIRNPSRENTRDPQPTLVNFCLEVTWTFIINYLQWDPIFQFCSTPTSCKLCAKSLSLQLHTKRYRIRIIHWRIELIVIEALDDLHHQRRASNLYKQVSKSVHLRRSEMRYCMIVRKEPWIWRNFLNILWKP